MSLSRRTLDEIANALLWVWLALLVAYAINLVIHVATEHSRTQFGKACHRLSAGPAYILHVLVFLLPFLPILLPFLAAWWGFRAIFSRRQTKKPN
jgi:cobalamin synthase